MSRRPATENPVPNGPRLDKWLWAARFFKTRALAQEAIEAGHVKLDGERVKPSRNLRLGDRLELLIQEIHWSIQVQGLSERRGPASEARLLYTESEASRAAREAAQDRRRMESEPARDLRGRPSKRDARMIHRFTDTH